MEKTNERVIGSMAHSLTCRFWSEREKGCAWARIQLSEL